MATPKRLFPAFVDLEGALVVVVGEGAAAEKRARQFLKYSADVVIVTAKPSDELLQAEADGKLNVEQRSYVRGDLVGATMVLCASEDDEVRRAVFDEAVTDNCLVNVSGASELSTFVLPSVFHRGSLQVAISTGGGAPEVAKQLRRHLESQVGDEWGDWLALVAEVRALAMERIQDPEQRELIIAGVADPSTRERLAAGERLSAEDIVGPAPEPENEPVTDAPQEES